MGSSNKLHDEQFIRVRIDRFSDGQKTEPLQNITVRVHTTDPPNFEPNPSKHPLYDEHADRLYFSTRTKPGRRVNIYISDSNKKNFTYSTAIADLIPYADQIRRKVYPLKNGAYLSMSIELITPNELRQAQRAIKLYKHYNHEFLLKYFTKLPGFCGACKTILWGFNTRALQCQLCDLFIHEQCIKKVPVCTRYPTNWSSIPTVRHNFIHEPNILPVLCNHDGKLIRPFQALKCSECKILIHSKCKSKVEQFCGTREIAVKLYDEWKKQNPTVLNESYVSTETCSMPEIGERNKCLLIHINQDLENETKREDALRLLNVIKETEQRNASDYYNLSTIIIHQIEYHGILGHGASASVYLVKYKGNYYALKTLRKHRICESDDYEYVKNERSILKACRNNPFIIRLYAAVQDFERIYLLLEYASCGTFYDYLTRFRPHLDDSSIKWFSGQIICAIKYLHSKFIIHRDLKPDNILLKPDGHLKLTDFGLCKRLSPRITETYTLCGTPEYIAPEIYQSNPYSFPVDYWSLGIVVYQMVLIKTPFYDSSASEIQENVVHKKFQCPNHMSPNLQLVLTGLLTKTPSQRFTLNELESSKFYSSPYSLAEIEQGKATYPQNKPIRSNPPEISSLTQEIQLSYIDEQSQCATLTINKDKFLNFSFIDF